MAKKKALNKTVAKTTRNVVKDVTRSSKNIARASKLLRDALGRFLSKSQSQAGKKQTSKAQTSTAPNKQKTKSSPASVAKRIVSASRKKQTSQARPSRQAASVIPPTQKTTPKSRRSIAAILRVSNYSSYNEWADTVLAHEDEIDASIDADSGERFAASYYGGRTELYENIGELIRRLNTYSASIMYGGLQRGDDRADDLLESVKIMKIKQPRKYFEERKQLVQQREETKIKVRKAATKLVGANRPGTRQKKSTTELLADAIKAVSDRDRKFKALERKQKATDKKLSELLAQFTASKKGKKNAPKKSVSRKTTSASTRKPAKSARKSAGTKAAKKVAKSVTKKAAKSRSRKS